MPLTRLQLVTRLARELDGTSVPIHSALEAWLDSGDAVYTRADSTAFVLVRCIGADGSVAAGHDVGAIERLVAVVPRLPAAQVVCQHLAPQRAVRVISDMAVFDVCAEGLVIVELAPGTSARDVQSHCEATVFISPDVTGIDVAPSVVSTDGPPVL